MLPGWVDNLDEYWRWLDGLILRYGAWVDTPSGELEVGFIEDPAGEIVGLEIQKNRVRFADAEGLFLDVTMTVRNDFVQEEYNYHCQIEHGEFVWRKDKHEGHPEPWLEHIHDNPKDEDDYRQYGEEDLDDALQQIRDVIASMH